jgi:hypothetical protein
LVCRPAKDLRVNAEWSRKAGAGVGSTDVAGAVSRRSRVLIVGDDVVGAGGGRCGVGVGHAISRTSGVVVGGRGMGHVSLQWACGYGVS